MLMRSSGDCKVHCILRIQDAQHEAWFHIHSDNPAPRSFAPPLKCGDTLGNRIQLSVSRNVN